MSLVWILFVNLQQRYAEHTDPRRLLGEGIRDAIDAQWGMSPRRRR